MLFPGYPVDVAVLLFLILIHWIVFYPVDSANNHNPTFRLVNKINLSDREGGFIHIESDRNDKKIFIGLLPVIS